MKMHFRENAGLQGRFVLEGEPDGFVYVLYESTFKRTPVTHASYASNLRFGKQTTDAIVACAIS